MKQRVSLNAIALILHQHAYLLRLCSGGRKCCAAAEAEESNTEEGQSVKEALGKAVAAVDEMLSAERCAALVEAVVTKYVALSPEELQEWQVSQVMHGMC